MAEDRSLEIIDRDTDLRNAVRKGRRQLAGALTAPVVFAAIPAGLTLAAFLVAAATPPTAAVILFFGLIATILSFLAGLGTGGYLLYRRKELYDSVRQRLAAKGIRASDIEWFRSQIRSREWRSLKEIEKSDVLLADAYRETLASRLTASHIVRSSQRELADMRRRLSNVKRLKASSGISLAEEIEKDIVKIRSINDEARAMRSEAEGRLEMIEAASVRGTSIADFELALKKLNVRATELPIALENAKLAGEIVKELEAGIEEGKVGE